MEGHENQAPPNVRHQMAWIELHNLWIRTRKEHERTMHFL
jgi:hypothetical protein